MRQLIAVVAMLVANGAWAMDAKTAAQTFGVTEAWVARAQQAVAWSQGQQAPASVDEVVAEMVSRLNAVVVQQEVSHGIDPATGQADPARLVADLTAARAESAARQTALLAAVVEIDSLRFLMTTPEVEAAIKALEATSPGIDPAVGAR